MTKEASEHLRRLRVFRKSCERRERELRLLERERASFKLEASMPSQGGALEPLRFCASDQRDEIERFVQRETSQLPCSQFSREKVALLDRPGESALCCPLTCHLPRGPAARSLVPASAASGSESSFAEGYIHAPAGRLDKER